ncbi:hypothetical protein LVY72_00330 [Arthrobacter sp. I2-34]|uniref:PBP domain-containing protein n=1 Tax=Arthrobacter hankyongi TaxID=2904801 RepID=A0ABS9L102_9MICC|nr:hypothetical protein [Arthrobacter hankyongi]MCG2620355.1 hypothetical protein [Arthrobacter hankyongi]
MAAAATAAVVAGIMAVTTAGTGPAAAAPAASGSDWGPQGSMASDSAVTVRWDNQGNAPGSVVPRDETGLLPHTDAKSYADVNTRLRTAAEETFGPDNGLGGLSLTVSQTQNLQNQAVTVSFNGAKPVTGSNGLNSTYLQVFQCWGAMGEDGKPDPKAAEPDPATCQFGAVGPDGDISTSQHQRSLRNDPLVKGGDWEQLAPESTKMNLPAPFQSIGGEVTRIEDGFNLSEFRNPFFNATTTNEHSRFLASGQGDGSRSFELQTGTEASGLGCGLDPEAPSVETCWLVAVPRTEAMDEVQSAGPLSPSLWAMRLQVPLHFQPTAAVCPSDDAATLSSGSEALTVAMKSWIPGICADRKFTLGFSPMADLQARQQLGPADPLKFTTQPLEGDAGKDVLYAPVALSGVVVAMTIDNVCTTRFTEYTLKDCGYANEAAFEADRERSGSMVRNLKFNARLLAKLLTQSYVVHSAPASVETAPFTSPGSTKYGVPMTFSLQSDPEFKRLNPTGLGSAANMAPPVVEGLRSDAAAAVWDWILADDAGRAFLNGCPDEAGMVINPFYSTRSYAECPDQAKDLDAAAAAKIKDTKVPSTFNYAKANYPSDSAAYPQAYWTERAPVLREDGSVDQPALTVGDQYARVADMAAAALNTVRAQPASTSQWCAECTPAAFKSVPRQGYGGRSVLSITDAASAAKFQLPTAQLCDTAGTACVGATAQSLRTAAAGFVKTEVAGVLQPAAKPDYRDGAYPLTLPVYGAVKTAGLASADAKTFASLFDYLSTDGQEQGFRAGMLPPGYAPLTDGLQASTVAAVKSLQAVAAAKPVPTDKPTAKPSAAPQPTDTGSTPPAGLLPAGSGPVPAGTGSGPAPPAGTPAATTAPVEPQALPGTPTARTSGGWPPATLAIVLGAALAAILAAPLLVRGKRR